MNYAINNIRLAKQGFLRIQWAKECMPVLSLIEKEFKKKKPFKNIRISACLHITTETASLAIVLKEGGARLSLCASNPLSTQDDVVASLLRNYGIEVFARKGVDKRTYYRYINMALIQKPHITIDDGADLVSTIHSKRRDLANNIIGGTEETTTGIIRLRNLQRGGKLLYPIIAVNDAYTKYMFDNRYGTGQSTIDGIMRATNRLLAGSRFVVCGYGWCGRGIAMRARGMGAHVTICEVEPLRALEAVMDGFDVASLEKVTPYGDIFVTATGDVNVLTKKHFKLMKDGVILANSGHFNVEIDITSLRQMSKRVKKIREYVEEFTLKNGRRINLLAGGRLVNLAAAEGHPAHVMDMSFANQALACKFLVDHKDRLKKIVYKVPDEIDRRVAILKLKSMGVRIDTLSSFQKKYLTSWEIGT